MTGVSFLFTMAVLCGISLLYWLPRRLIRQAERRDGAPSLGLVRLTAAIDVAFAAVVLGAALYSRGSFPWMGRLWRHDVWSALLIGALAGSFLHVVGGGSPLPLASLRSPGGHENRSHRRPAGLATVLFYVAGEASAVLIWFGAALGTFIHVVPRLVALAIVAAGYGSRRAASGQDHPLLGGIDGLLLALLSLVTGSLLAALVAHLVSDVLAYVSAASQAEEADLTQDAGEPAAAFAPGFAEHSRG